MTVVALPGLRTFSVQYTDPARADETLRGWDITTNRAGNMTFIVDQDRETLHAIPTADILRINRSAGN